MSAGESYTSTGARVRLEGMPFGQANTFCDQCHPGAHLVVISDAAEHEFLFDMFYGLEPTEVWVGLFYNSTTLAWEWVNGEPALYVPWEPFYSEPLITHQGAALMYVSEVITPETTVKYGYGLEVSDYLVSELGGEAFPFICEYSLNMMQDNTTWFDTGNTTNFNTTGGFGFNNTSTPTYSPGTTPPPTFAPQVLFQQEARPMRLSEPGFFGSFIREVTKEERQRARPAYKGPMQYNQRGAAQGNNRYPWMAMP